MNNVDRAWHVADTELDDLGSRLARTHWPTAWPIPSWQAGTNSVEPERPVEYWQIGYD